MAVDVATLEIRADSRSVRTANRDLDQFSRTGNRAEKSAGGLTTAIKLATAAYAAFGVGRQLSAVVREQETLQRNMLRTEQIIRSTGRAADISAEQIRESARAMARVTLESTENIMEAQQQMLTLGNISVDMMDRATETALDMSAVMGGGLSTNIRRLGRLLEDPAENLNTLSRYGIRFSEDAQQVIQALIETGDHAQAQVLILDELADRYGGAAKAEAMGLAGAQDTLSQSVQEARIAVADLMGASERLISLYEGAADTLGDFIIIIDNLAGHFDAVRQMTEGAGSAASDANDDFSRSAQVFKGLAFFVYNLKEELVDLGDWIGAVAATLNVQVGRGMVDQISAIWEGRANTRRDMEQRVTDYVAALNGIETSAQRALRGTIDLADVTDQFTSMLGQQSQVVEESADGIIEFSGAQLESARSVEEVIAALERELRLMQMSARERRVLQEIEKAGIGITLQQAAAIRENVDALFDYREGLADATDAALDHADATDNLARAADEMTFAMRAQERMLENIQRSWGDMFYEMDLSAKGFFDSVTDGFRRMLAEMASADLVNAIFGGQGLSALTGGNTVDAISNIVGLGGQGGGVGLDTIFDPTAGPVDARTLGQAANDGGWSLGEISAGNALQSAGAGFAGRELGTAVGEELFGKEAQSAFGAAAGSMIGAYFGGPLGSFIGGSLGGAVDAATGGDGMQRHSAGMLVAPTPGADPSRTFDVDPFASGFTPQGFARRAEQSQAMQVIDEFRAVDAEFAKMIKELGGTLDLTRATLGGLGEEAEEGTAGTFLGLGGLNELTGDVEAQIGRFVDQLVDHVGGLEDSLVETMKAAESTDEVFRILREEIESQSDAANDATGAISRLTRAEEQLVSERVDAAGELLDQMADIRSARQSMSIQQAHLLGAEPLFEIDRNVAEQIAHIEDQRRAAERAHQQEIRAEERLHRERMRSAQSISDTIVSLQLGDQSHLSPQDQFSLAESEFRDTLAAAEAGDTDAAGRLSTAAQTFAEQSQFMFASSRQHKENMDDILGGLERAREAVEPSGAFDPSEANQRLVDELSRLDSQLSAISYGISDRVVDQLENINVHLMDLSDAMRSDLIDAIGQFVTSDPTGDAMLHALGGIEGSVDALPPEIASAMSGIMGQWATSLHQAGMDPQQIARQVPSGTLVEDALNEFLDQTRQGIVVGGAHIPWNPGDDVTPGAIEAVHAAATAGGVTSSQLADALGFSRQEILDAAASQGLPAFAGGTGPGGFGGGWRIVGERGPELEYTGPSHIVSNSDWRSLLSAGAPANDEVVKELRGLRNDNKVMRDQMGQLVRIARTDGELSADQRQRMTEVLEDIERTQHKSGIGSARYARSS